MVLLCHGQGTFQTPSLLTYVHLPEFDFINPDCHLLGKKSDPRQSTAAGRENLQSKSASVLLCCCVVVVVVYYIYIYDDDDDDDVDVGDEVLI